MPHVLIVDDDTESCRTISELVGAEGCTVAAARDLRRARIEMARRRPDVLLADLSLPDGTGLELVGDVDGRRISEVVLTTAHASVDTAIEALRNGASDYLIKPVNVSRLRAILARLPRATDPTVLMAGRAAEEVRELGRFGHLLGRSASMQAVYDKVARVAPTEAAVLLVGESGTGKELTAHTLHDMSGRALNPFIAVNCAAIAPAQFDSEMFGDGSANAAAGEPIRQGHFERAEGGTLFLDEITEIGLDLQIKLLRVLETGRYSRGASDQELQANVRVIAATQSDPQRAVHEGKLRADLYHLLNVFPVHLPPLRERKGDVALLARHFFNELNQAHGTAKGFPPGLVERLARHRWSGNVRELRSFLYRIYILCDDVLDPASLEIPFTPERASLRVAVEIAVGTSLADADRQLILATLAECGGVKKHCAKLLGISLKTLYNRLDDYGLSRNRAVGTEPARSLPLKIN